MIDSNCVDRKVTVSILNNVESSGNYSSDSVVIHNQEENYEEGSNNVLPLGFEDSPLLVCDNNIDQVAVANLGEVYQTEFSAPEIFDIIWEEQNGHKVGVLKPASKEDKMNMNAARSVHQSQNTDIENATYSQINSRESNNMVEVHYEEDDDNEVQDPSYIPPTVSDDWISDDEEVNIPELSVTFTNIPQSTFQETSNIQYPAGHSSKDNLPRAVMQEGITMPVKTADLDNSFPLNVSINDKPVGESFRNPATTKVNCKNEPKQFACKFCGKILKHKIARHLQTVHKDEDEVKKLSLIPKIKRVKGKQLSHYEKTRARMIREMNSKGNFLHNLQAGKDEIIITSRRSKENQHLIEFRICPKCKGLYKKLSIRKHYKSCMALELNGAKKIHTYHNMVIGDIHETANPLLRKALAGLKKLDDACSVLKYDPLIIAYGNMLACKFQTSDHHGRQIRAQMRLLGRLVLTLKSLDADITHLGALYHPAKFDILVRATYILGKFDKDSLIFKSPATARDIGHLVKEVKKLWVLECTEKNQDHLIDDAKKFMRSFKAKFSILIGTTIVESQTQMNIVKGAVVLPKLDDIKKLNVYLIENRRKAYSSLQKEFQILIWKQLAEFT
ncbi:hypothetical protein FQR65_LT18583 [Abscondita terminalis]|nr:hypothetical protein FQR65_LT18583 [Abscondita terminalis]